MTYFVGDCYRTRVLFPCRLIYPTQDDPRLEVRYESTDTLLYINLTCEDSNQFCSGQELLGLLNSIISS
jgi:hypothetical protein